MADPRRTEISPIQRAGLGDPELAVHIAECTAVGLVQNYAPGAQEGPYHTVSSNYDLEFPATTIFQVRWTLRKGGAN